VREIVARTALSLGLALVAPASQAQFAVQVVAPDVLLRSVTQDVMGHIKLDADLQAGDPVKVAALVEAKVLPLFDFERMTQSAMARNWHLASPAQQSTLVAEFTALLVHTYSSALANYSGEVIEFRRLRAAPGDTEVTVKSEVKQGGRQKMSLDYDMEKTPAGWRIYDVQVAGVRLVTTYRETFAEQVRESGVEGLIKSLSDTNGHGESRFKRVKASVWEKSRLLYEVLRGMLQRPR
jgi:phospholipid transport system substrate-binding protein